MFRIANTRVAGVVARQSTVFCRSAQARLLQTQQQQQHKQKIGASEWYTDAAVAFDIDGVLVRGKRALAEGKRALAMLNGDNPLGKRIPFVLLTNGGGVSEAEKAAAISESLGVEIGANQVVLAHSPMRSLAAKYADKHVLIVGGKGRRCADIARMYGLNNVSTPNDVVAWNPSAWPFMDPPQQADLSADTVRDFSRDRFHAVMVFHDSFDFGRDLQVATDVLRARNATVDGEFADKQSVPLYMSNSDLVFSNEYPRARYGQGAYHVCLRAMWHALTNGAAPLEYTLFGKPEKVQYGYAERLLNDLVLPADASSGAVSQLRARRRVYAVGDNPPADIAGANRAGWTSILVRTGVFTGAPGTNDTINPAHKVADHVEAAVEWIIRSEQQRAESE
ncbi:hypothetical protein GGI11_001938 [Coemansia sp. RSA 2049]|nr:hypothetical protein H4217_007580 [Coemansia sp. RSA 1939]KAJ2521677.1 hypothetical protein GGI11_001938 [Coemansia sp. RSA 2049]KAJ2597815.1 hypothetical protein EV177_007663 [Coemansia sp. RSA 1804]KAJ2682530.1 hypothetical protein GGH99_004703 [Coemansia sp. RSA 1285]